MYELTELICVVAEVLVIALFLQNTFPVRERRPWLRLLCYGLFGAAVFAASLFLDAALLRLLLCFFGVAVLAMVLFEAKPLQAVLASLTFSALVALSDVLLMALLMLFGMRNLELMQAGNARLLYLVIGHLSLFALVVAVCMLNRRRKNIALSPKLLLPLLPCWLSGILLCCILTAEMYQTGKDMNPLYLAVVFGLLYTNIVIVYYTNRIKKQEQDKADAALAAHHYAMQEEYYEQLHAQQEETRALWHDIGKYLRAMQADAQAGETLLQLQEKVDSVTTVVDVNNRAVSVILNEYLTAANDIQAKLTFDVQVPSELFVTAADLYILLGNTLDNALEACARLPEEQREIKLQLRQHNDLLFYRIENPCAPEQTAKKYSQFHGYGLKNVQSCVKKYRGTVTFLQENGTFQLIARLNRE